MYIKNLDEPMLFVISDGKVSAILCLGRWGKMLCVSQLNSLTSDILTPTSNSFTVLAYFNFSFVFVFFCLIGSLTVLPFFLLLLQRKLSLDYCKITQIKPTWYVTRSLLLQWRLCALFCHLGRQKFGPSFQVNCR